MHYSIAHNMLIKWHVWSLCSSPKAFLPSSVPDLQFDLLPCYLHNPGAKLHSNGMRAVSHDCVQCVHVSSEAALYRWEGGGEKGKGRGGEGREGRGDSRDTKMILLMPACVCVSTHGYVCVCVCVRVCVCACVYVCVRY